MQIMNQQQMHPGMDQMNPQQIAMMRMQMQQQGMISTGEPMPNMMRNGSSMEMMGPIDGMGPNEMMMRGSVGSNGPNGVMGGMPRTTGHHSMMQGHGNGMMPGMNMQGNMMGPGHPAMKHGMSNRPPLPEYGMTSKGQYMMSQIGMGPGPNIRMYDPPVRTMNSQTQLF